MRKHWMLLVDFELGSFRYFLDEKENVQPLLSKLEKYVRLGFVVRFELSMEDRNDTMRVLWNRHRAAEHIDRLAKENQL